MYGENSINDPTGEVVIDKPHRGDIRCRKLIVSKSGSVFGNVVADEVRVAGRIGGTVHAKSFYTAPGSKVSGAVNASDVGIKPGTTLLAHFGPEFPAPHSALELSQSTEAAILTGIDQAAKMVMSGRKVEEPRPSRPAVQAQPVAAKEAVTIPQAVIPPVAAKAFPAPAVPAPARTALPSIF